MTRIKISYPFPDWPLSRQTPGSTGVWNDTAFFINPGADEEAKGFDAWFVLDKLVKPHEKTLCPPENIICITWEPPTIRKYSNLFLKQFAQVITCHPGIKHPHRHFYIQGHPWFVDKTWDELTAAALPEKTKTISVITSNKTFSEGHLRRYEFCLKLKEHFGDAIDLFGRGLKDFDDKWDVLAPYKYSIAIENADVDDWITEKLFDCYLAASFPFFYGCPNINKYFAEDSYERIDIYKPDEARATIEKILSDPGHYTAHLPALLKAKKQCLDQYNIFPLMHLYYQEHLAKAAARKWNTLQYESALFYRLTKRFF